MYINYAAKHEVIAMYSVEVPKELENASEEELRQWIESGDASDIEYVKELDSYGYDTDLDYLFEIVKN